MRMAGSLLHSRCFLWVFWCNCILSRFTPGTGLQKIQTLPCTKACIRLISFVFSSSVGHAEFQRQVVLPNVAKFSQGLIETFGKYESEKLKVGAIVCVCVTRCLLLTEFPDSVLGDSCPAGLTLPFRTQTTSRAFVCTFSQAPQRFFPSPVFG